MDKRQKLLLIGGGIVIVILLIIGSIVQYAGRTQYTTKTTVSNDPVTGEQIVDVEGKSPEKPNEETVPSTIGADAIYSLFGAEEVFRRLEYAVFQVTYKDHSFVRIAKEPVTKRVTTTDGTTVITVDFDTYLDRDNVKKDHHSVSYNQETGDVTDTFQGDYTPTKTTVVTSVYGDL